MSLNKVLLIGRLGRDPELRYMPNGEAVCNFSLATGESWTDRNTGQRVDRTEWHNITLYRRPAEVAAQYLKKGAQVYLEGRIQSRKYTDKQGMERTAYDIVCSEMKMLDSKNSTATNMEYEGAAPVNQMPAQSAQTYAPAEPPAAPARKASAPVKPVEDIDDDIPF